MSKDKIIVQVTSEFDWWSKYYYSTGEENKVQEGYQATQTRLRVYSKELEAVFHKSVNNCIDKLE